MQLMAAMEHCGAAQLFWVTRLGYYYFVSRPPLFRGLLVPSAEGVARKGVLGTLRPPQFLQASGPPRFGSTFHVS